jgi:uncharacterized repeat protein (TIGR01451 family)
MRRGSKVVTTLDKIKSTVMVTLLVLGAFVLAVSVPGEEPPDIPTWPADDEWINYTFRGERIRDWEDKPYENDPTHGIANVQPKAVDIASGVDKSGGNAASNPGNYTSVQYIYDDVDGDSDGCTDIDDDWLFLRQRVAGDPRHGGQYAYKAYHWDILLEVDGDQWSEFVVDLNGGNGYFKFGTVGVYYSDTDDYEYDPDNDWVWLQEATGKNNKFTNPRLIDYDDADDDNDQWWIEYKVPVTAFTDQDDNQLLCADTEFLLFFSTSASATNPLQKDWMGEFVFGEPANITVVKTVEEDIVKPGDTLHYKIYYNNTGEFNAGNVWINDTIPDYTTFKESNPPYNSSSGQTYRWHFTDVEPGNHTIFLNVTVDTDVPDGEILRNVAVLNYTDTDDNELPGSEDETENPVAGPFMNMSKEADVATADPGDDIHYVIKMENTGGGGAYNVTVNDTIPGDTTFKDSNPNYESVSGDTYTFVIDKIAGKTTAYIHINVTVDAGTADETLLVNYATLDYVDANGNTYDRLHDWANVTVTAPIMDITKIADVTTADPGDEITYTLSYDNTGTGQATDVVVKDTIPEHTTFVSSTPNYDAVDGRTYTWNIGTVDGGDSGSITLTVSVDAGTANGTILTNDVTLDYDDANGNPYPQESDSVDVTVTAPILTLSKTASITEANPGDSITYSINYENTGSGKATNVYVNDTIPNEVTFVTSSPAYTTKSGNTYIWEIGDVCAGCSGIITIQVTVNAAVPDETVMRNTVTLDYSDANGNPYAQLSDYVDVTVTAPIMTITKVADVSTADPGDEITYTLTYENTGTGDASGVVVKDTIPTDTIFVSSNPAYSSKTGNTYTWNVGTVTAGSSGTITIVVKVKAGIDDETVLLNKATLYYEDVNGNPYPTEEDTAEVTVTSPIMTVSKTADVATADPGDEVNYTLSYDNTGTGNAKNVKIIDTIPSDVTFVTSYPTYTSVSGNVYTWNVGDVCAGCGGEIYVIVEVNAGVADGSVLTNYVKMEYTDDNGNSLPDETDSVDVTVTAPVMTITKTADVTTADPGDQVVYTLFYENTGTGDATDVVVEDTIPSEVDFVSSNPTYDSKSGNVYTWNVGDVGAGDNGTIAITVEVKAYTPDKTVFTNYVTMDYDDANGNPIPQESDSVDVTVTAPVMTITKTADVTEADPGDEITYTITYTNSGTGQATDVVVEDTIPADTDFVSSTPTPDGQSGNTYTWNVGDVSAGDSGTITVVVEVKAGTPDETVLTNTATLDYDDANGNPQAQQNDSVDVTVTAPVMTVSKVADVATADPSDLITYTIEYKNTGSGDATNVKVVDTIPADTTAVSATPPWDSSSGDDYTWNIGNVAARSSGTITFVVEVDVGTADGTLLKNWAVLSYADANGNSLPDEEDYADVTVTAPIMTISKIADVSTADPSDIITYTLTYENTGNGEATNVWVNDTIPADVDFVSSTPAYTSVSGSTYTWFIASVAANSDGTITVKVEVKVGTPDQTVLKNTVTLDYGDANGNPQAQEDDYVDVLVTAPVFTFSKTADVVEADPGDWINYTLYYKNTGTGDATNVFINDTIPADTTLQSTSPAYTSSSGDTYTWDLGTVSAGDDGNIIIAVTVDAFTADGTVLRNTATLDYSDANGNPYPQKQDHADVTVTGPEMTITKGADVSTADPGDEITYTITYKNTGTGTATDVVVKDTIPTDTVFVSSTPAYDSKSGDTYTWLIGDVCGGCDGTIEVVVRVKAGTPDKTVLTNSVTLNYDDANGNPQTEESDSVDVIVTAPVMTVSKVADVTTADPDDEITYTIEYKNTGTGEATNIYINDTIPADTTYVSSNPVYTSVSGDTYTWFIASVGAGQSGSIELVVKVDVGVPDKTLLRNQVTLDYADANENPLPRQSDKADVTVTAPVFTFSKKADVATADPGDQIVYTIEYENTGTGEATDIYINDTIPSDVDFVSSNPNYTSVSGNTYTWYIASVAGGTGGTITITVKVKAGIPDETLLRNEATLDYSDANGNPYPQMDDHADVKVTAPILTITKTADVSTADPDDEITYTLAYENKGTGEATDVYINDTIPADVDWVSSNPGYTSVSGSTYTWYFASLAAGASGTITIVVKVKVGTPDGTILTNDVTLDYSDANGNSLPQESDSVDVKVTAPIVTITKTADVSTADPGDEITYTIYYKNTGTGEATDLYINDTIPTDTEYVSSSPVYNEVNGLTYTWKIASLAAGADGTITLVVKVKVGTPDETLLRNRVTLDYSDANGNPYPQKEDTEDVVVTAPVMAISKVANVATADPGDFINYTISYENSGTGVATNVWINDTIPADTTFKESTPNYDSASGDTYTWFFSSMAAKSSGEIHIKVQVDAGTGDGTILRNTVTMDYADANGNPYAQLSDYVDVLVTAPVLNLTKSADVSTADPSDEITYTVEFENSGSGNATDVYVNDTIPSDVEFVSSNPVYLSKSGNTYTWYWAVVAANTTVTITIVVKVKTYTPDETVLHNIATLDYADANGNPYPTEMAWADVTVTAPILEITKTADVSTADPGDEITYTIYYKNTGTGEATDLYINDTIPDDVDFVSSTPNYTSVSGKTYTWFFSSLAAGADGTITITVEVKVGTPDETLLRNLGTLDFSDANGNPYPILRDYADVDVTAPVMEFSKRADVTTADPDDEITYTITYKNIGTGVATNVKITDTIPGDVVFVSSTPNYTSVSGNTYTWDIGTLNPGEGGTITIVVKVKVGTPDETLLRNFATLDYSDANENPYEQMKDYADVDVTAPVMEFSKVADAATADPDDEITYTLTYKNVGTGVATNVKITDTIPGDVVFVSSTPNYTSVSGNTYTWDIGTLNPGDGGTITIVVKVKVGTQDETLLRNVAILYYSDANENPYTPIEDQADVYVTAPVMRFSKRADVTTADPDDEITYTITYENVGTGDAANVKITDTIPADVTFVSSTPTYTSVSGNTYTWDIGTVTAGSSGTITITVKVKVGTPDETLLRNVAILYYSDANENPYTPIEDTADVTVTAPVMEFSKTADVTTADPDDEITYTISYENVGTGVAKNVKITDTIPGDVVFVSSTPNYTSVSGNTYTWDIGTLNPGDSGTITIVVKVKVGTPDKTLLRNGATLDYSDANENPYDQMKDHVDVTVTAPVMEFSKSADVTTADPDDPIAYTITYENVGTGDASNVKVTDTIPADVVFVSSTPTYTSVSGNTYTWDIGTVAAGTGGTITINVKVKVGTPDETLLENVATLYYADANGNAYTPMTDNAFVKVTAPVMEFSKTADTSTADPSDLITYTITYKNIGTGDATGVLISDEIPADVEYVSSTPTYTMKVNLTYIWNIGDVAAGTGGSITLVVKVKAYTADKTLLHNVATLYYEDANGNDYTPMEDHADVIVTAPVMRLVKSTDVTTADPGDEIVYTIHYANVGTGVATHVTIVDTIPVDTTFISSTPSPDSIVGNVYTWYIGTVNPGDSGDIFITVRVNLFTPDKTLLRNVVTLDYNDANSNPYPTLRDSVDVKVTAPVMEFSKFASVSTADPGDEITYTLAYDNVGTGKATEVKITDTLPVGVTLVSATPLYDSVSNRTYTWDIGDLGPGEGGTIIIVVEVDVGTADRTLLHNSATLYYADANGNDYPPMEDSADVTVTAPVMTFSKSVDVTTADPGDQLTYTLTYENTGTGWASSVVIVDTLPADVIFVSSNPMYDSATGNVYTWNLGDVAPGTSGTITIIVKVKVGTPDETLLRNRAMLDYSDANGNFVNRLRGYADVIVTAPILHITKSASVSEADPGDMIIYTITYENTGTGWATLVEIVDTIPADTSVISTNPRYTSVSGNDYTWSIGDLAPGDGGTIEIGVIVIPGTPDETLLHNVVTLEWADRNGNYYPQLSDYADVVVTAPVMTLDKTAGDAEIAAYVIADFRLRIAGEKWHDVRLNLYSGGQSVRFASITRYPGSPDDQSVTLYDVKINLLANFTAVIEYTPDDDPINGQIWGDNPCWLILTFPGGKDIRLFHNFNVRHEDTWIWVIDDWAKILKHAPIIYEATIPYTINYENIGTGDATGVVVTDTLPVGSVILDYDPLYDSCVDNVCTWNIGDVASGESGTITINISYVFDIDGEELINEVTLDYDDANGNFIEQLYASASSVLIKPELWSSPKDYSGGEGGTGYSDNIPPEAVISTPVDGSYHYVDDAIQFDGSGSYDDGMIVSYLWDFGDGGVSTEVNPHHHFAMAGIYAIRLTVTDEYGDTSTAYVLLIIREKSLSAVIELPTKEIIAEGTTLEFSGRAVYEGYQDVFQCSWDFGDGASSEGCTTTHYYGNQGTYTITLTVFDAFGHMSSDSREITVLNVRPKVKVAKHVHGTEGTPVYFAATVDDLGTDELVLTWDMGDGNIVVGNDFYYTYLDDGKYVVKLTVDDGDGGAVVKIITAAIENLNPEINVGSHWLGHVHEAVFLSASVSDAGAEDTFSVSWDMGDGTIIEGTLKPVHIYSDSGIYTVTLTVSDEHGAQDVSVVKVHVIERLDSMLNRPTSWKDTSTPMAITPDSKVAEGPMPLAALALIVLSTLALAGCSYVWVTSRKE